MKAPLALVIIGSALAIIGAGGGLVTLAFGSRPDTWAVALNDGSVAAFASASLILALAFRRRS